MACNNAFYDIPFSRHIGVMARCTFLVVLICSSLFLPSTPQETFCVHSTLDGYECEVRAAEGVTDLGSVYAFTIHYSVHHDSQTVDFAVHCHTLGYIGIGFPLQPGVMRGADAVIASSSLAVNPYIMQFELAAFIKVDASQLITGTSFELVDGEALLKFSRGLSNGGHYTIDESGVNNFLWAFSEDGDTELSWHGLTTRGEVDIDLSLGPDPDAGTVVDIGGWYLVAVATFEGDRHGGVEGSVRLSQNSGQVAQGIGAYGDGTGVTEVEIHLSGLGSSSSSSTGLRVHEGWSDGDGGQGACDGVGTVFDPDGILETNSSSSSGGGECGAPGVAVNGSCAVGQLGERWGGVSGVAAAMELVDPLLPLFGSRSCVRRSVVLTASDGSVLACAVLQPQGEVVELEVALGDEGGGGGEGAAIQGVVELVQLSDQPDASPTWVRVQAYWADGRSEGVAAATPVWWELREGDVAERATLQQQLQGGGVIVGDIIALNCSAAGLLFDPFGARNESQPMQPDTDTDTDTAPCDADAGADAGAGVCCSPLAADAVNDEVCAVGQLGPRMGPLLLPIVAVEGDGSGAAAGSSPMQLTHPQLPLSGNYTILHRSLHLSWHDAVLAAAAVDDDAADDDDAAVDDAAAAAEACASSPSMGQEWECASRGLCGAVAGMSGDGFTLREEAVAGGDAGSRHGVTATACGGQRFRGGGRLAAIEGELAAGDAADVFALRLRAGSQLVAFTLANADPVLSLYTSTGRPLRQDDDSAGDTQARIEYPVAEDGVYYLAVHRYASTQVERDGQTAELDGPFDDNLDCLFQACVGAEPSAIAAAAAAAAAENDNGSGAGVLYMIPEVTNAVAMSYEVLFSSSSADAVFCSAGLLEMQTCFDGEMNQDEEGVDCGGVCAAVCPPTCVDGVQNADEEGVDCGGWCEHLCSGHPCMSDETCSSNSCVCTSVGGKQKKAKVLRRRRERSLLFGHVDICTCS